MKKILFLMFTLCVCFHADAITASATGYKPPKAVQPKPSYEDMKRRIAGLRLRLKTLPGTNNMGLLEKYFVQAVTDSVIQYWYGTAWDFNGTTQAPGKGTIACGYFVSTVLRDVGLPINRVRMGQMSSEELTYILAEKKDVKLFYEKPLPAVISYLQQQGPGLYIIGLDCHVGFILVDAKGCWFIHAKWFGEKAVVKEDASTSSVLYWSKYRMVAKISNSKRVLMAWVYGREL